MARGEKNILMLSLQDGLFLPHFCHSALGEKIGFFYFPVYMHESLNEIQNVFKHGAVVLEQPPTSVKKPGLLLAVHSGSRQNKNPCADPAPYVTSC
jgi:hypothetical protein